MFCSKSGLFSKLSLIGHNLCCGRPISQRFLVFSSYLIVLQYDVLRSAGPNCPFSEKKRELLVGVLSKICPVFEDKFDRP